MVKKHPKTVTLRRQKNAKNRKNLKNAPILPQKRTFFQKIYKRNTILDSKNTHTLKHAIYTKRENAQFQKNKKK